jgi:hypothetical protein
MNEQKRPAWLARRHKRPGLNRGVSPSPVVTTYFGESAKPSGTARNGVGSWIADHAEDDLSPRRQRQSVSCFQDSVAVAATRSGE